MTSYIVMEPDRVASPGDVRLVPDRFVLAALIAPLLWLLWHRLWLETFLLLCAGVALGALASVPGMEWFAVTLALLLSLLVSLEGGTIRAAAMRRRGWREAAIISASSREEAETRYFHQREAEPFATAAAPIVPRAPKRPGPDKAGQEAMLGMLDYPGAR